MSWITEADVKLSPIMKCMSINETALAAVRGMNREITFGASALTRVPVRSNIAMTGEITLRGRVLPIGGLKEKMIAAHRGGVDTVLIPKDNEKDLKDLPPSIKKALNIILVEHMDEVLALALAVADPETFLKDGVHDIDDIYEFPKAPKATDVAHPAGVN